MSLEPNPVGDDISRPGLMFRLPNARCMSCSECETTQHVAGSGFRTSLGRSQTIVNELPRRRRPAHSFLVDMSRWSSLMTAQLCPMASTSANCAIHQLHFDALASIHPTRIILGTQMPIEQCQLSSLFCYNVMTGLCLFMFGCVLCPRLLTRRFSSNSVEPTGNATAPFLRLRSR